TYTSATYTADGEKFRAVVERVDSSGNSTRDEWTGKFDGKQYPVTGNARADMRAIKKINDHKYEVKQTKSGKPVSSGTIAISKDGKTRTVKITTRSEEHTSELQS